MASSFPTMLLAAFLSGRCGEAIMNLAASTSASNGSSVAPPRGVHDGAGRAAVPHEIALLAQASAGDFPMIVELVDSFCGFSSDPHTLSKRVGENEEYIGATPCRAGAFSFAVAFTQCLGRHDTDSKGFAACLGNCTTQALCDKACSAGPHTCNQACTDVAHCTQTVVASNDQLGAASAESALRECLEKSRSITGMAGEQPTVEGVFGEKPGGSGAPSVSKALFAQQKPYPSVTFPATAGKAAPEQSEKGSCSCATSVDVRGLNTGRLGCARHGGEPTALASDEAYCFVEGGSECEGARPSVEFPGLFWTPCAAPNFKDVFPATCELSEGARPKKVWPSFQPLTGLNKIEFPHLGAMVNSLTGSAAAAHPEPVDLDPAFEAMRNAFEMWTTTLSPEWHRRSGDLFLAPSTTTTTTATHNATQDLPAVAPVIQHLPPKEDLKALGESLPP